MSSSFNNAGPFSNLHPGFYTTGYSFYFWSSTPYPYIPTGWAMGFSFGGDMYNTGNTAALETPTLRYAWAVRDGDVASAPPPPPPPPPTNGVPEPTTMLLLSLGLIGVAGIRKRMKM